jgi:hypothetical protein
MPASAQFLVRVVISALLIATAAAAARRSSLVGALLASLPLTSLLAMVWLWLETHDAGKIAALAGDILWLVVPSLLLFVLLPVLLRAGWGFWPSLAASCAATIAAYAGTVALLQALRPAP